MNDQDSLEGFYQTVTVMELFGTILVVLMGVWIGYYRGGVAWTWDLSHQFNWHPLLMTLGMIVLYGNGIVVYRVFRHSKKEMLKNMHAFVFAVSFTASAVALVAVFDTHDLAKPAVGNLYTLHSWIGLAAVALFACQWVCGFVAFLFPKLHHMWRSAYLPIHRYFGMAIFLCSCVAAITGLLEKAHWVLGSKYQQLVGEAILINLMGVSIVIFGGLVLYAGGRESYRRKGLPDELPLCDASRQILE